MGTFIRVLFTCYYYKIKEDRMDRTCSRHGADDKCTRNFSSEN
jgi:hypothetical protein